MHKQLSKAVCTGATVKINQQVFQGVSLSFHVKAIVGYSKQINADENVWWPGIDHSIKHFLSQCTACTISDKGKHAFPKQPIKPVPFPVKPCSKQAIDILCQEHRAQNHARYIILRLDIYSKRPEFALVANITTQSVTTFMSNMFPRWGIPEVIISYHGRQFVSNDFAQCSAQLGINPCKTALSHPHAKTAFELFNRVLKEGIIAFKAEGYTFDDALRLLISNYHSTPQSTQVLYQQS